MILDSAMASVSELVVGLGFLFLLVFFSILKKTTWCSFSATSCSPVSVLVFTASGAFSKGFVFSDLSSSTGVVTLGFDLAVNLAEYFVGPKGRRSPENQLPWLFVSIVFVEDTGNAVLT